VSAAASRARGLALLRLSSYLGNGRELAEFEDLLGRGGRKQVHAAGDDAGPCGLMTRAALGPARRMPEPAEEACELFCSEMGS
jgi:hypothetical protein